MVIEWLKFRVPEDKRERFIQCDLEIWTPFLEQCPGFLTKEVWIQPDRPQEVVMMIRWHSREEWKSISAKDLKQVGQEFDQALGFDYDMVESQEYQVRRFPRPS
ncbi:MAG: TIGR03792 family protein [Thainema sp.]